ncbi:MAG: ATP-binding protein [Ignavibacteriaceae bacterium]
MEINVGRKIDEIQVTISNRIIELFSAGLYSSPNKAFEELVCNSYDANADCVGVYVDPDLSNQNAFIWVCDNGDSMDQSELKLLWKVGVSNKRDLEAIGTKRLQIGRFGIGKLATYILTNNLTYICKKDNRYLLTKMDYSKITDDNANLVLDEIELSESEAKSLVEPYIKLNNKLLTPFELFGSKAKKSWTLSILTNLKPKATEIREGRLKWVLQTALPLSPGFNLSYNGTSIESSKIKIPILKTWIVGKEDDTASKIAGSTAYEEDKNYFLDLPNLKGIHGTFELYEDSLLEGKSSEVGRSHGIFLMIRERLINLDDPLLGMEAFSHGAFNKTRIIIYADQLDNNIASTREAIQESIPYFQLKDYIKKKFNNEVRKFYFDSENQKAKEDSLSYRLAQTPVTISKNPIITFVKKYFEGNILNPWLLKAPICEDNKQSEFIEQLDQKFDSNGIFQGEPSWEILSQYDPIAIYDVNSQILRINLMHPFIANYSDSIKSTLPFEFIATTEILTEAHMYEIGVSEDIISSIMKRRDKIFRELVFSDRLNAPLVAGLVKDALSDPAGLEEAVYKAFTSLGFETKKIGGNGKPDGKADAILGYSEADKCENYSLTYDAKSTGKTKIKANTGNLAGLKRHRLDYKSDFSVLIAIDYEGSDDPESAISKESTEEKVTVMKAKDLMRLLLYAVPKQIGLRKLKELFENCYTPTEVGKWIDDIEKLEVERGPLFEVIEIIYELQKTDSEPPEIATIRMKLNEKLGKNYSKASIIDYVYILKLLIPGFINVENEKVGIHSSPQNIKEAIEKATNSVPVQFQKYYVEALNIKTEQ